MSQTTETPTPSQPYALVLGGSGYLGSAVVEALILRGWRVVMTYWSSVEPAQALQRRHEAQLEALQLDLRDEATTREALRALIARRGAPQALVHCAGLARWVKLDEVDSALWEQTMQIHVSSVYWAVQELAPAIIKAAQGAQIILPMAVNGVMSVPAPIAFGAAQGARQGLMRALAKELGAHKIMVNAVTFGPMEGGLSQSLEPQLIKDYKHFSSLGRLTLAQEAAKLIAWLAAENKHMTGATLSADGGL